MPSPSPSPENQMSIKPTTFETLVPSRFITLTFPNPFLHSFPSPLHTPLLRISVIDSPTATATSTAHAFPRVAAMLVPPNRESDWTFSTERGHLQLLGNFPDLLRLILIANNSPNCSYPTSYKNPLFLDHTIQSEIRDALMPLMLALTPESVYIQIHGLPDIPFLSYDDEVIASSVLEICFGPCVGEMLIENVELDLVDGGREFRRRLRFKRMPNLVQSQVRIHLQDGSDLVDVLDSAEFRLDTGILSQPYLSSMVLGLSLRSSHLDGITEEGLKPRVLCLGVGGGALVSFLTASLGFEVVAVEEDEVVLSVAKKYFGLRNSELVHLCVGDGIEFVEKAASSGKDQTESHGKFDAIMVDLDSSDLRIGTSAPPLEFVRKPVLLAAKKIISENGVLIINVISPNKSFYEMIVNEFEEVFEELYEIDVRSVENTVLVASVSEIVSATSDHGNRFLQKLKASIQECYVGSMRKITRAANC